MRGRCDEGKQKLRRGGGRVGEIDEGEEIALSRPGVTKKELERYASAGGGAANRAAHVDPPAAGAPLPARPARPEPSGQLSHQLLVLLDGPRGHRGKRFDQLLLAVRQARGRPDALAGVGPMRLRLPLGSPLAGALGFPRRSPAPAPAAAAARPVTLGFAALPLAVRGSGQREVAVEDLVE